MTHAPILALSFGEPWLGFGRPRRKLGVPPLRHYDDRRVARDRSTASRHRAAIARAVMADGWASVESQSEKRETERMRTAMVLVLTWVAVTACKAGVGEAACGLLDDFPSRVAQASVDEVEELAETAMESDTAEIRVIGEQIALNLSRRHALENLAPGASIDVLEADVASLREACRNR